MNEYYVAAILNGNKTALAKIGEMQKELESKQKEAEVAAAKAVKGATESKK